jgi:YVTN family beta-propeller protein
VANSSADTVSIVSTATDREVAVIPVGATPWRVSVAPDGGRVYVIHRDTDQIAVIDVASRQVVAWLATGAANGLMGIAVVPR